MTRRVVRHVAVLAVAVGVRASAQTIADPRSRREALELFRTGQEYMSAERFDSAAETFSDATAKDPLLTVAHYGLGQAYMALRRFASAIKAFKDCLDATRALYDLRATHEFDVDRQREDEIRELRGVLDRSKGARPPTLLSLEQRLRDLENQKKSIGGPYRPPAEALLSLGSAYFRNGNREEAEIEWKAASEANPNLGEAHNNLAVIYMQTGRLDEADRELTLAEKSGFRVNPQFKDDLRELRNKK
jgi:tetratricopeptide (TPR) repeat protein